MNQGSNESETITPILSDTSSENWTKNISAMIDDSSSEDAIIAEGNPCEDEDHLCIFTYGVRIIFPGRFEFQLSDNQAS